MPQPEYVPVRAADEVRPVERLPAPKHWRADRPGDQWGRRPGAKSAKGMGVPGPDQGYALRLARQFKGLLFLAPGESEEDAVAGCLGVALKRASLFGRAPVIHDLELAYVLWGYAVDSPADLVEYRRPLFQGAAHHYWDQRAIADRVPEASLRLTPEEAHARLSSWRQLISV